MVVAAVLSADDRVHTGRGRPGSGPGSRPAATVSANNVAFRLASETAIKPFLLIGTVDAKEAGGICGR